LSPAYFRGDSAAASLKPVFVQRLVCIHSNFRGDSAAASLKLQKKATENRVFRNFRGDSAAASLKLRVWLLVGRLHEEFPRRFRRGLIEAISSCRPCSSSSQISAAIPPRPH